MNVTVAGNLVADPKLQFTQAGQPVAHVRLAHTERRYDGTSWTDGATTFLSATVWGRAAENVAESLRKGDRVLVCGRLRQNDYQTDAGERRTGYELTVDEIGVTLRYLTASPQRPPRRQAEQADVAPPVVQ
jgi:single-strand DNA-binding protein